MRRVVARLRQCYRNYGRLTTAFKAWAASASVYSLQFVSAKGFDAGTSVIYVHCCPRCQAPMRIIERLTAFQLQREDYRLVAAFDTS